MSAAFTSLLPACPLGKLSQERNLTWHKSIDFLIGRVGLLEQ